MSNLADRNSTTGWDTEYARQPGKKLIQVWRDAYGGDYPEEVEPYSFLTKTDLERIHQILGLGPGNTLVDLGCGRGGPGLWLARESGADLIGIDLSPRAVHWATSRIAQFGLAGHARFIQGDLCTTNLPDGSCHGAISIDVLAFVKDKDAIMKEVARILQPDALFVFTALERKSTDLYSSPLQDGGFRVEQYDETPDYVPRRLELYKRIVAQEDELLAEMGEGFGAVLTEARNGLADGLEDRRRALVVGRRI